MWFHLVPSRGGQSSRAGGMEENPDREKRRLPRLKNPGKIWKNLRQQNHKPTTEDEVEGEEAQRVEEAVEQEEERLEEVSRKLIIREEQLFSQESFSEGEENQLLGDQEALRLQIITAIHNTFTSSPSSPSSPSPPSSRAMEVLRSAVVCIQQQEEQDRRWTGFPADKVPVWRPQKYLSTHNKLLQNMVESRLMKAAEEDSDGTDGLSTPLKREVCRVGRRVKEDLLTVGRLVVDCYPPQMDILNLYAGLYHQSFSARLNHLAASELETGDCSYLLLWINICYPNEILKHEDLEGRIKTACLGSLLQLDHLERLEDQYLTHKEDQLKLWLNTALRKEEESWLSGKTPELIDQYCFSPLAIDIIQVIDVSLSEFSRVIEDQIKAQRLTAHLESFLTRKCVEEFVKGKHTNMRSVIKAQLVCELQFRDYITGLTGSVSDQQRQSCLDTLSALKDCGYRCLTRPNLTQLKESLSQLWTAPWMDGSLPVMDSLLDSVNQQLSDLSDLKPACREALLSALHQDLVRQYVKRTLKTRTRTRAQQVGGAQRMTEDAQKINDFFSEGGCRESMWLGEILCSLAEILQLHDPGSVQLEMVSMARTYPDFSNAHVSALLSLKTGLSAADVRSIRRSVEENRLINAPTNQRPPFFSKVKVKWINNKINQMGLKN
ncbi:tumor necrosis factor alpha-induced protein 2a isoform X2 [Labrus mixtus]|uniref:tumor necrosis factor alpha-induced protein 2a isoform X2 n=1 Tax=Labrus mixtus TaxID=508554 RepID=UPI0029C00503|nr:tumor necrosis factor alpha-induced protein 2a isoform X2 [Labrus mixtus]